MTSDTLDTLIVLVLAGIGIAVMYAIAQQVKKPQPKTYFDKRLTVEQRKKIAAIQKREER